MSGEPFFKAEELSAEAFGWPSDCTFVLLVTMYANKKVQPLLERIDYLEKVAARQEQDLVPIDKLEERLKEAEEALEEITEFVEEQANDEALWCCNPQPEGCAPISIGEAIVQAALRALHALIEVRARQHLEKWKKSKKEEV